MRLLWLRVPICGNLSSFLTCSPCLNSRILHAIVLLSFQMFCGRFSEVWTNSQEGSTSFGSSGQPPFEGKTHSVF